MPSTTSSTVMVIAPFRSDDCAWGRELSGRTDAKSNCEPGTTEAQAAYLPRRQLDLSSSPASGGPASRYVGC